MISQAARLQSRQRLFNLTVTNVPGPQFPLYLLGRRLRALYPQVPLAANAALGIAIMSYDGALDFGLLGDYDAMPDLDRLATDLRAAIESCRGGGVRRRRAPKAHRPASRRPRARRVRARCRAGRRVVAGGVVAMAGASSSSWAATRRPGRRGGGPASERSATRALRRRRAAAATSPATARAARPTTSAATRSSWATS